MATIAEQLTSLANTKAAIKQSIIDKGVAVADTDPFSAYPAKIGQISGGGAPATKFGVSLDNLLGNVDENGVYVKPTGQVIFDGTGIKTVTYGGTLAYLFYNNDTITKLLLPDLEVAAENAFVSTAEGASNLTEVNLGKLTGTRNAGVFQSAFHNCHNLLIVHGISNWTSISGVGGYVCQDMFNGCSSLPNTGLSGITEINDSSSCIRMYKDCIALHSTGLNNLTTINGSFACQSMFEGATNITDTGLQSLETISGTGACQSMFKNNTSLVRADFPALTVVSDSKALGSGSYNGMFVGCTNLAEIHFRADAQATIEGLSGYAIKFGAPSTCTIYFSL